MTNFAGLVLEDPSGIARPLEPTGRAVLIQVLRYYG